MKRIKELWKSDPESVILVGACAAVAVAALAQSIGYLAQGSSSLVYAIKK